LLIILLFISGHLKAQDINTLKVDSQLSISLLLGEISGMSFHEDNIYALNDGGNGSYIFKLDIKTGELKEKYRFFNIKNQ